MSFYFLRFGQEVTFSIKIFADNGNVGIFHILVFHKRQDLGMFKVQLTQDPISSIFCDECVLEMYKSEPGCIESRIDRGVAFPRPW